MPSEKICPSCGENHSKRGPFCCQSCANSRPQSEESKEKKRKKLLEYYHTPEGAATRSISSDFVSRMNRERRDIREGNYILSDDDWMLDITSINGEDTEDDQWL